MIDDEQALLSAAAANPDDDTLRLAYADWLDEHSGEVFATQAAFVRLQVRRSQLSPFDPDRGSVLDEEAAMLKNYRRGWNGRIHHRLHRRGLRNLVDARRGAIRRWDYHRGMVAQVAASADAFVDHADLIFSLGPVESLRLIGWPASGWTREGRKTLDRFLPRLKVLTLVGGRFNVPLPDLTRLGSSGTLGMVPLLDLRPVGSGLNGNSLLSQCQAGALPSMVLFRGRVVTPTSYSYRGREYVRQTVTEELQVVDPFGHWDSLRLWYADLTGEVLSPVRYQSTSR